MIVNQGTWCQATVSTGAPGIRSAMNVLRRAGYRAYTSSLGQQVTEVGRINMTIINVALQAGGPENTFAATSILKAHIPELRHRLERLD